MKKKQSSSNSRKFSKQLEVQRVQLRSQFQVSQLLNPQMLHKAKTLLLICLKLQLLMSWLTLKECFCKKNRHLNNFLKHQLIRNSTWMKVLCQSVNKLPLNKKRTKEVRKEDLRELRVELDKKIPLLEDLVLATKWTKKEVTMPRLMQVLTKKILMKKVTSCQTYLVERFSWSGETLWE